MPLPAVTVCEEGLTARVKSFTASDTEAECDALVLEPSIEMLEVPAGVEPEVVTVRVEVPEPEMVAGLKLAVAPVGRPLALRVTVSVKPLVGVIVTVYVAEFPTSTEAEDGVAEMAKSGVLPPVGSTSA